MSKEDQGAMLPNTSETNHGICLRVLCYWFPFIRNPQDFTLIWIELHEPG
jgi:hypothetical protein